MKRTKAYSLFKKQLGQANHFLVTALVAFHDLEGNDRQHAPEALRAAWNPKDKSRSIARSRIFVQQSFLSWAVDSVDTYFSALYRRPNYIQDPEIESLLDGTDRSVFRKFSVFNDSYEVDAIAKALVEIMIAWRNNVIHSLATNIISDLTKEFLFAHSEEIQERHRGLIIQALPEKAEAGSDLTFKETASLIAAAHDYVASLDSAVLSRLDHDQFVVDLITAQLESEHTDHKFRTKITGLEPDRSLQFLENWLANEHGIRDVKRDVLFVCLDSARLTNDG